MNILMDIQAYTTLLLTQTAKTFDLKCTIQKFYFFHPDYCRLSFFITILMIYKHS